MSNGQCVMIADGPFEDAACGEGCYTCYPGDLTCGFVSTGEKGFFKTLADCYSQSTICKGDARHVNGIKGVTFTFSESDEKNPNLNNGVRGVWLLNLGEFTVPPGYTNIQWSNGLTIDTNNQTLGCNQRACIDVVLVQKQVFQNAMMQAFNTTETSSPFINIQPGAKYFYSGPANDDSDSALSRLITVMSNKQNIVLGNVMSSTKDNNLHGPGSPGSAVNFAPSCLSSTRKTSNLSYFNIAHNVQSDTDYVIFAYVQDDFCEKPVRVLVMANDVTLTP